MNLGLENKVALVTGASRGIGRATSLVLADEGCDLVLAARGREPLELVADEVRRRGRRAVVVTADVGVQEDRERLPRPRSPSSGASTVSSRTLTNLDVYEGGTSENELWDAHFQVDVLAAVRLTELLAPGMRERRSGAVVFVSSISGLMGQGTEHGYVAMKAALIAAGKTLAVELVREDVRVNVVAPGTIDEPGGWMENLRTEEPERVRTLEESIPAGRFGMPQEVASCIAYLLSDRASWIVGHCLVVDGGQFPGIR